MPKLQATGYAPLGGDEEGGECGDEIAELQRLVQTLEQEVASPQPEPEAAAGLLERVAHMVKLGGFVASTPDFTDQPKVANGASDLMAEVFGDAGKHARSAVGVPVLPLNAAVEVDAIVALKA